MLNHSPPQQGTLAGQWRRKTATYAQVAVNLVNLVNLVSYVRTWGQEQSGQGQLFFGSVPSVSRK